MSENSFSQKGPKEKTARVWNSDGTFGSGNKTEILDYSARQSGYNPQNHSVLVDDKTLIQEVAALKAKETEKSLFDILEKRKLERKEKENLKKNGFFDYFKGLIGGRKLTQRDLEPVLFKMKEHLCRFLRKAKKVFAERNSDVKEYENKNVAEEIAESLCKSVLNQLENKEINSFEGLTQIVKETMIKSVERILVSKTYIDFFSDIENVNKKQQKAYTIVFCGVNGVGKSTNLAKIAHHFVVNKGHKIMIAACDTFRSGAVEQLRTHVNRLNHIYETQSQYKEKNQNEEPITLYDKGYGKDPSVVASEAISKGKKYAKMKLVIPANRMNKNVVLIDTAGRMQDNEPLMRSLAKLIHSNNPDRVLFVGEALVGNDGIDQLTKFNEALRVNSLQNTPRLIDGIILTKFDTIDDKVGAALSMTYKTGKPIMFVGVGQTYGDLKPLDAGSVTKLLFS